MPQGHRTAAAPLLRRLGLEIPIMQAPMAGGPSTPELVAAVSNAGGLGWLGAAYMSAEQIGATMASIRKLTDRPFGVNLFAGGDEEADRPVDPAPMLALLAEIHDELGIPPPALPAPKPNAFPDQLAAVLDAPPAAFGFTFGVPGRRELASVRAGGAVIVGTATTAVEARLLEEAGVDAVLAQGQEAGAHRGTFAGRFEASMAPTLDLVQSVRAVTNLPVIASGGLMGTDDVAAAIAAGAAAVALGTAFLVTPESGASGPHKAAILAQTEDRTLVTRAFSGRPARAIGNAFTVLLAGREADILPFPIQNSLTRAMRTAAAARSDARFMSLFAGSAAWRAVTMPAADLVRLLVPDGW